MSHYQRIFLIADPSMRRTPAFDYAQDLATRSGARLHVAIFDYNNAIAALGLIRPEAAQQHREIWMDERLAWLWNQVREFSEGRNEVTVEAVCATKPMQDEILQRVAERSSDLVIKDVHHESRLRRVLFKPLDWNLLRTCPVPLLLVQGLVQTDPRRVIAAVDATHPPSKPLDLNDCIIQQARKLASLYDAEVHLLFSFCGPNALLDAEGKGLGPVSELRDLLLPLQQAHFRALAQAWHIPVERQHFLHGMPSEMVSEFTRSAPGDVLVVGAMRHTLMDRLVLGTTAEAILDEATCTVMAIKL